MNKKVKVGSVEVPVSIKDMTTEQYLRISEVLTRDASSMAWADIFVMLGANKSEVKRLDISTELSPKVVEFVTAFNEVNKSEDIELGTLEIDGHEYEPIRLEDGSIRVTSIDEENMSLLVASDSNKALVAISVLYKKVDANDEANEAEASIKNRMKIFAKAPASKTINAIMEVNKRLMQIYKKSIDASREFEESKNKEDAGN